MELTSLRAFLLTLPGTQEDTPFGPEILVYR
ncbi:MAG TPA: MmcQ-like protein, partial [Aeromonas salmonicida]|nr:MmcQ-like protein [Aeromonas salmonicida]